MKQLSLSKLSLIIKRSLPGFSALVIAPTLVSVSLLSTALPGYSLEFPETSDRGAPSRTSSGGTRSDLCHLPKGTRLRALVPHNNVSTFAGEQASLWIHLPAELSGKTAELFVKNARTQEVVYEQQFPLADLVESSIAKISLPATKADGKLLIASHQNYFWELAVICDASDRARDHFVQGFIHRVDSVEILPGRAIGASAEQVLIKQAEQYAAAAVWQETLEIALLLKDSHPTVWLELLSSVDLSPLATEPLLEEGLRIGALLDTGSQRAVEAAD